MSKFSQPLTKMARADLGTSGDRGEKKETVSWWKVGKIKGFGGKLGNDSRSVMKDLNIVKMQRKQSKESRSE